MQVAERASSESPDERASSALPVARSIGAFVIGERVHQAGAGLPLHVHETACVCFAVRGTFTEGLRGRAYPCAPFEVVLKPPREPHWNAFASGPATVLSVKVAEPRLTEIRDHTGLFRAPHLDARASSRLLAMRIHEAFRLEAPAMDLVLEGLLLELLGSLAPRPQPAGPAPAFKRATDFIESNVASSFAVEDVAAAAGVHPAQLARLFRKHAQCSVGSYVRAVRVEHAKRLLQHGSLSLAEVALEVGFCDQSHLTRVFRTHTRVTPAAFRRAMKGR